MKLMMAATAAMLIAGPAMAEDWRLIDGNDQSVGAIDSSRITETPLGRQFWNLTVFKADSPVAYSLSRIVMDCQKEELIVTFSSDYDLQGNSLAANATYETAPIIPGSRSALMFESVCRGTWQDGTLGRQLRPTILAFRAYLDSR